jgi:hypothetical protein
VFGSSVNQQTQTVIYLQLNGELITEILIYVDRNISYLTRCVSPRVKTSLQRIREVSISKRAYPLLISLSHCIQIIGQDRRHTFEHLFPIIIHNHRIVS